MSENIGRHWMGGAQRAFGKKAKNPVEMQKLFFASQEQKRLMQRTVNCHRPQRELEPFLEFNQKKSTDDNQQQMKGSELSRDEMTLLAPSEVKKDVPLLAVWLDN